MLSGVTGGVLPPPPQASSNPDRKKLDTKARELNRITSSQSVRKNFAFAFCVCGKSPGGPSCFCWRCLPRLLTELARRRNAENDLPIRGQAENTLFPSVVACKEYVEVKSRSFTGGRSRPQVQRQRGNRGKKSPGETRPREAPLCPSLVCFAGMQPITAMAAEKTRVCEAHDVDIPWDIDRSSARCQRSW